MPPEDLEAFRNTRFPTPPNFSLQNDPRSDAWARLPANFAAQLPEMQRIYYAQTRSIDRTLGRLLSALDAEGAAGNTMVVFTSDHGEMFGAQGRQGKNIFYDEAVRIPFLVRWPGRVKPGVSDACFNSPDIMPTLLSLLGLPVPRTVEGSDFSRAINGQSTRTPEAAILQGMGTTAAWKDGTEWRALRDGHYTYAAYRAGGQELLFDNRADRFQTRDLANERAHRAKLQHYREQLRRWMKEHNDAFEACTWYERNWTVDRNIVRTASGVGQDLDKLKDVLKRTYGETAPA